MAHTEMYIDGQWTGTASDDELERRRNRGLTESQESPEYKRAT